MRWSSGRALPIGEFCLFFLSRQERACLLMTVLALVFAWLVTAPMRWIGASFTNCIVVLFGADRAHELAPRPLGHGSAPARDRLHTGQTSSMVRATLGNRLATEVRVSWNCTCAVRSLRPLASLLQSGAEGVCRRLNLAVLGRNPAAASSKMAWHGGGSFRHSCRGGAPPASATGVQSHHDPKRRWIRRIGGVGEEGVGVGIETGGVSSWERSRSSRCARTILWASSHLNSAFGAESC